MKKKCTLENRNHQVNKHTAPSISDRTSAAERKSYIITEVVNIEKLQ